jgi:hypothetical protein
MMLLVPAPPERAGVGVAVSNGALLAWLRKYIGRRTEGILFVRELGREMDITLPARRRITPLSSPAISNFGTPKIRHGIRILVQCS